MTNGWVKFHRKILENPIVTKDSDYFSVWSYLVLMASHEEHHVLFGGEKIKLMPGQLITGRKVIADFFSISESKVRRILNDFESDQQIDRQKSNKSSLISLKNWDKYQITDQQNDQQLTNKRPTSDQQATNNWPTTDQQLTTTKERKEGKEGKNKNIYTHAYEEFWKAYPRKKDKGKAFQKFNARLSEGFSEVELIEAAKKYALECSCNETAEKYIKHPSTFLSTTLPFLEYLEEKVPKAEENPTEDDEELVGDDW